MTKAALIIGATGGIGSEVARSLARHGYQVRALHRDPERAKARMASLGAITWLKGDAMSAADVLRASTGVSLVVHAAIPPGYRNWQGLALPCWKIASPPRALRARRLVFPGTVYNFGPETFPSVAESAPQQPRTRKARFGWRWRQRLSRAAREGVPVLIVARRRFLRPSLA